MKDKKTFFEFLNERDPSEIIYVGTKHGSSWLWIDTADWFIRNMAKNEEELRDRAKATLAIATRDCKNIPGRLVMLHDMRERETDEKEQAKLDNKILEAEMKFIASHKTRIKYTEIIRNWVVLGDRKVVKTYKHTTEVIGPCVILEGYDCGTLWSIDEKK